MVRRLAGTEDLVLGRAAAGAPFDGIRFRAVTPPRWSPLRAALRYAAGVAAILREARVDAIEVHNRPDVARLLARRFPRCRITLFLHNDPQGMRGAQSAAARRGLLKRMRVVAVSDWVAERFRARLPADADVAILPNCLDLSALPPRAPRRDRLILFAGRTVADKGADCFVRAMETLLPDLPNWRAEMIGADRFRADAPRTPFEDAVLPRAEAAGIVLHGHKPHAAVLEAMARAAIVVVPSRWPEPFGLVALEAMASGAALVCSGRGGLGALVGSAALLADPEPAGPLEEAIRTLAGDSRLRNRLGKAGLKRASAFDLPQARARLARLRGEAR
ncbi:glycosyltransferase family 4 protein [Acetobacteraceae bacterium KSS8]|uniref:Glycosyltransferase family 4 protein n=1 Tax=Endosaccharibacter trunci TaxID=2812733 RepID=A0ABT1W8J4_9PROT|nr:glycosyltransferase family 4 protein [Acetobacteraceae bacterium KSS8]